MGGALTVYRWELRKLLSQKRTYIGLLFATAVPIIFVTTVAARNHGPEDVPFGRYVLQSGLAVPLVLLTFGAYWLFPLITALVAGDIVASEDHNGTLKTILTRSLDRAPIFAGKALAACTYAFVALLAMAVVALVGGGIMAGFHSLVSLSGTTVHPGRALVLIGGSFLVYFVPMLGIAAIGLLFSTLARNSAAAVVGTLMLSFVLQLVAILPGLGGIKPYLLTNQFFAWHGFLRVPTDWAPIGHALWVCAIWFVASLVVGAIVFVRRDVAGG
ncbi:MAG: ABC transporter permease [Actinobacteria bacterium]|nr:ABC transporter permease [Actinomycetota bacterium]